MITLQDIINEMPGASEEEIAAAYKARVDQNADAERVAAEAGVINRRSIGMTAIGEANQRLGEYSAAMNAWIETGDGDMPVL